MVALGALSRALEWRQLRQKPNVCCLCQDPTDRFQMIPNPQAPANGDKWVGSGTSAYKEKSRNSALVILLGQ